VVTEVTLVSEGNVERVRGFTQAFNESDVEGLLSYCDPEVEFHSTFSAIGGNVYRGHDGGRSWHRDLQETWGEDIRSELEALFDLGDGTVLVFTVLRGRGQQSGVEALLPVAVVARLRDGLLVYYRAYVHKEDALEELGVSEDELVPIAP
jgi:ketosteroid isomerase-like protein